MSHILVVEEAFVTRGSGVVLEPKVQPPSASREPFAVRLRLPSGSERHAKAAFEFPHIKGPLPARAMLRLFDLTPAEVPPGTTVIRVE